MEEEVQKVWTLLKADRIQNVDYAIGVELTNLYSLMKEDLSQIPDNFEDLLLSLIVINKGQISIKNAHLIALCCVFYYKRQNPPNYWKLIPILTEEVKKLRKPSIYILGLLSKLLCDGFKSQLPTPIQYLLNCNDESLFPLICQCFRRIIKGTGTFLIQQIPDIFGFIFAGSSSSNESIRIESVKSIPTLLEHAHISIKKLLPIVGQLLPYTSKEMRFYVSKSLAKLIFIGAKTDSSLDGKKSSENIADTIIKDTNESSDKSKESNDAILNPFKYAFKIILQFAQTDKNAETLALTMNILLRFYEPIEIVKRLRTFTNFVLCIPNLKLPLNSALFLSNGIIKAVISVVGSTIGNSICYHIIESIKNSENDKNKIQRNDSQDSISYQKKMIALTSLINFDASTKTFATAAKQFYPLLSSNQKDIQKVCITFFAKLGKKEENLGRIFIDTFCSFLATVDDNRSNDIDGFSKAASSIIVSVKSTAVIDSSIEKVKKVITSFLNENNFTNCKMAMAYLLLASLAKIHNGYDLIPSVFNITQAYLKTLPNRKIDKIKKKTIKYISLYFLQIIMKPPDHSEKLALTIRHFISLILPNVGYLSKSGQFIFLKLAKNWFHNLAINNEKIADFIVRSCSQIFLTSFEKETKLTNNNDNHRICRFSLSISSLSSIDADLCGIFSADLGHSLYNFETPSNRHVSIGGIESLTEVFISNSSEKVELKSDNDFLLYDLPYWITKCSQKVLNEAVPPLFEFNKLEASQIISKLKLITFFLKSKRDFGLTKAHFKRLLNLEKATRIDSNSISNSQKQKLTQIQFALSQAVSQWFITNFTFSDAKTIDASDLNLLLNGKNLLFSSLLISFVSNFLCDEVQVQTLLFLMQNIQASENPVLIFALRKLLSSFRLISDFSVQIGDFLENLLYSNDFRKASIIKTFCECVFTIIKKVNSSQLKRIALNLLHFPTNSTYAELNGLWMSKFTSPLFENRSELNLTLEKPLPILISSFCLQKVVIPTIDDVPLLFMMLQQTEVNDEVISKCILAVFKADSNVKKWTNFAKRIVIIGCVPPAERKGDIRILPTMKVLLIAIKIAVLLVSKIRDTMELRCVDDIVSISFTAIHMEKREIDLHCYSILSSVIQCFEDVRNEEGSLLDVYFSQFHPTFCHAFDEGKRELKSVASFVISYFRYVEKSRKNLIDEVSLILVNGLKKMRFDADSLVVFCRVASLIYESDDQEFNGLFKDASSTFMKEVLIQKRSIIELKEELPNFVSKIQKIQTVPNRILLALLICQLKIECNSVILEAVTNSVEIENDIDAIDFVLKTIANSDLIQKEADEEARIQTALKENQIRSEPSTFDHLNSPQMKLNEIENSTKNHRTSDLFVDASFDNVDEDDIADNEIDRSSFWIHPIQKPSSINHFLVKITKTQKNDLGELFESILTLSLNSPICFGSLCNILKMSSQTVNCEKFARLISAAVLTYENRGDEILALFKFMFGCVSMAVIDSIVPIIVENDKLSNSTMFEILRYAFTKLNGFQFNSIFIVVSRLQKIECLLPDGLNFVGSLLVSPKTALTGLYLLNSGLLTPITTAIVSPEGLRILPRIIHFFNTALNFVRKICDKEDIKSFSLVASRVALVSLAQVAGVKERAAVVKPACLLIKSIDSDVFEAVFKGGRLRKKAVESVTPQRQAEAIQLLTFANVSNRKSNTGEWQTLEIDDDE